MPPTGAAPPHPLPIATPIRAHRTPTPRTPSLCGRLRRLAADRRPHRLGLPHLQRRLCWCRPRHAHGLQQVQRRRPHCLLRQARRRHLFRLHRRARRQPRRHWLRSAGTLGCWAPRVPSALPARASCALMHAVQRSGSRACSPPSPQHLIPPSTRPTRLCPPRRPGDPHLHHALPQRHRLHRQDHHRHPRRLRRVPQGPAHHCARERAGHRHLHRPGAGAGGQAGKRAGVQAMGGRAGGRAGKQAGGRGVEEGHGMRAAFGWAAEGSLSLPPAFMSHAPTAQIARRAAACWATPASPWTSTATSRAPRPRARRPSTPSPAAARQRKGARPTRPAGRLASRTLSRARAAPRACRVSLLAAVGAEHATRVRISLRCLGGLAPCTTAC
jgi:hypothetical protein